MAKRKGTNEFASAVADAQAKADAARRDEEQALELLLAVYPVEPDVPLKVPPVPQPSTAGRKEIELIQTVRERLRERVQSLNHDHVASIVLATKQALQAASRSSQQWLELREGEAYLREITFKRGAHYGLPRGRRPSAVVTARLRLIAAAKGVYTNPTPAAWRLTASVESEGLPRTVDRLIATPQAFGFVRFDAQTRTALTRLEAAKEHKQAELMRVQALKALEAEIQDVRNALADYWLAAHPEAAAAPRAMADQHE